VSHNVKLTTKVMDMQSALKAAAITGFRLTSAQKWQNKYGTGETYRDVQLLEDANGKLAGVITKDGSTLVDPYYMGPMDRFLREYAAQSLQSSAVLEGGWVSQRTEEADGSIIVEICLP